MVANFDAVNITGSSLARADEGLLLLTEELKRLDLPTLGRPMRAILEEACFVNHFLEARPDRPTSLRASGARPRRGSDPLGSVFRSMPPKHLRPATIC